MAWTWEYHAPFDLSYNCLAYALGVTNMWIWPFDAYPTSSEVTLYMNRRGYTVNSGPYGPKMIEYK
ncbi:MAG: DUF7689 domain-containing protein [Bacillota bacterium]